MQMYRFINEYFSMVAVILALTIVTTCCQTIERSEANMNEHIELYSWVKAKDSILLARIVEVQIQSSAPGKEKVRLRLKIEETLWGATGEPVRECEFLRSVDEIIRLKFPDPVWGRVTVQQGTLVLLVTLEQSKSISNPVYVEDVRRHDDTVLASLRKVLQVEKTIAGKDERVRRYLSWLAEGSTVPKLFGAQALAQDPDLGEVRQRGEVVGALTNTFVSAPDLFVRMSVLTWLWENVYPTTTGTNRVAILNALIKGLSDRYEIIREFSFYNLVNLAPADLRQGGVVKNPEAVSFLEAALVEETSPDARAQIQRLIEALR